MLRVFVLLAVAAPLLAQAPPPHLKNYVRAQDDSYGWKIVETITAEGNTIATLKLTSQKWQNEVWEHDLQVFLPKGVIPTATMILMNDGGTTGPNRTAMGLALAQRAKAPVAIVYGVPKQPLYGKKEDALIAETFVKYLETQDPTWPLLFPMVKSVIKAMDAVQAYAKQEWKFDVTGFVVTGASKRGWTAWLTAATGDARVKAIAPMVFDSLKMMEQMPHQVKSFGDYSLMIRDYKDRKLLPLPETDAAKQLWAMVDPWVYREHLTMPKLIVNGTNDPYWTQDALNLYWNDLKGPKAVLYVPNAGHDLRSMKDPAAMDKDKMGRDLTPLKAIDTVAAFSRGIIESKPIPKFDCVLFDPVNGMGRIDLTLGEKPKNVRSWKANSETRDFRKAKWTAVPYSVLETVISANSGSDQPYHAFFVEVDFERDGQTFSVSTPVQIVERKK